MREKGLLMQKIGARVGGGSKGPPHSVTAEDKKKKHVNIDLRCRRKSFDYTEDKLSGMHKLNVSN